MKKTLIGQSVIRKDALEKVTGAAKYVADLKFRPLLYAKILRSPYAHAKIISIDTSKAEQLPGVKAVVTGKEFNQYLGLYLVDRTLYASDKVRYIGEAVAGVAATSLEIAEEALKLIEVEYEVLPTILDPEKAMEPDAPLIHEKLHEYKCVPFIMPVPHTNISNHFKIRKGDIEEGFAQSDYIFEDEYYVPQMQHAPIEPHGTVAHVDLAGKITIHNSCQSPNATRKMLASALNYPINKIRVIAPYVGGGFGGKAGATIEALVVPLALKTRGYYVSLLYEREEEFRDTFVRQGMKAYVKTGVTKEGKLLAQELKMIWDGGAYTEYGSNITRAAGYTSGGPYEIPNMKTDSYCVYTNKPVGGPFRGFGMGELHWALEQQLDQIAHKLGIDPVQIRILNACKDGSINAYGEKLKDIGLVKCIEKAAEDIGWGRELPAVPGKKLGLGIACMVKGPSMPPNAGSSAVIKLNEDGTANLLITATEIGQGSNTALAQIAAEELGMSVDKLEVALPDTEYTPYEWQTVASRITYSAGNAVIKAARDVKRQLKELAAVGFGVTPEEIDVAEDKVFVQAQPEKYYTMAELALGLVLPGGGGVGGPIVGRGSWVPEGLGGLDPETGQGVKTVAHWTFGCQAALVEVDEETGQIELKKVSAVYDIGRVVNPAMAEGQTQGGIVQGQGVAFHEAMLFDEKGKLRNPSFVDYKLINAMDMPEMSVHFVETPLEDGPYGARGFGEHVMVPTAPAIANALFDAVGVRVKTLPMTGEKVLAQIKGKM